jgi:hypothetical protein
VNRISCGVLPRHPNPIAISSNQFTSVTPDVAFAGGQHLVKASSDRIRGGSLNEVKTSEGENFGSENFASSCRERRSLQLIGFQRRPEKWGKALAIEEIKTIAIALKHFSNPFAVIRTISHIENFDDYGRRPPLIVKDRARPFQYA